MAEDEEPRRAAPNQKAEPDQDADTSEQKEQMREALDRKEGGDDPIEDEPRKQGPAPNTGPVTGTDAADVEKRTFVPRKT